MHVKLRDGNSDEANCKIPEILKILISCFVIQFNSSIFIVVLLQAEPFSVSLEKQKGESGFS